MLNWSTYWIRICQMDFMMVSSYHGGTASSGVINNAKDVTKISKERHVLFVEISSIQVKPEELRDMLYCKRSSLQNQVPCWTNQVIVEIEADYTVFTIPK